MGTGPYIVTSFDFGGSSTVMIHIVTDDLSQAREVFARVRDRAEAEHERRVSRGGDGTFKTLVELTDVSGVCAGEPVTLFWGRSGTALDSNNVYRQAGGKSPHLAGVLD